ncbi:MAG: site-2 protease family protein [Oscillospiraceae bacterium]
MIYIIAAILIFGVLIAVHELGHFLAAKACGVRVNEFAIGMGPALLKKTKGDTQYSLRLLPIGGFCAMEGEEEDSSDPAALNNQGFWQKLLIFAAGALMNFLAGLIIILVLYAGVKAVNVPVIRGFAEGCPWNPPPAFRWATASCPSTGSASTPSATCPCCWAAIKPAILTWSSAGTARSSGWRTSTWSGASIWTSPARNSPASACISGRRS